MVNVSQIKERLNQLDQKALESLEKEIDKKLLEEDAIISSGRVDVIIAGEYPKEIRDIIANKYRNQGGYNRVTHATSSESDERPGLTKFSFYFD